MNYFYILKQNLLFLPIHNIHSETIHSSIHVHGSLSSLHMTCTGSLLVHTLLVLDERMMIHAKPRVSSTLETCSASEQHPNYEAFRGKSRSNKKILELLNNIEC